MVRTLLIITESKIAKSCKKGNNQNKNQAKISSKKKRNDNYKKQKIKISKFSNKKKKKAKAKRMQSNKNIKNDQYFNIFISLLLENSRHYANHKKGNRFYYPINHRYDTYDTSYKD